MEVGTKIEIALTLLSMGAALSAASWARSVVREVRQLRDEVLVSLGGLRKEVAVRRVIRTMDEVPPELMSPEAREWLDESLQGTKVNAAAAVKAAVELGFLYSEINRGRDEAAGDHEAASPSSEEDGDEPPEDPGADA